MIIAGLDIASCTGVAWINPSEKPSSWRCLAIQADGDTVWEKVDDFDEGLRALFTETRPDFVAIERPLGVVVEYESSQPQSPRGGPRSINAKTVLTLAGLTGNAIGILNSMGIPFGTIADKTWRNAYFGPGYKPRVDWKEAAVDMANLQGIPLPPTKKAARDAAEAVGVAVSWARVNSIPRRHQAAFMALRTTGRIAA